MKKLFTMILAIALIFSFASVANAQITKDQYYARSTLSGNELNYYDAVYDYFDGKRENEPDRTDYGLNKERANILFNIVHQETPQFYNVYGFYPKETDELEKQLKEKSKEILSYIDDNMDDIEKFRVVYAYLGEHIEYDVTAARKEENPRKNKEAADAQTIIGGLVNGKAVCTGMAASMQYILYQLDIPCYMVTGSGHAWNIVKLNGSWYITDLTHYKEVMYSMTFFRILMDERYYEWYGVEPDEFNPLLPERFSYIQWDYTDDPPTYERPAPTPTTITQPITAPVKAAALTEQEPIPIIPEETKTNPAIWIITAGAAVVILLLIIRKKKNA